jgi:hypothetical protein
MGLVSDIVREQVKFLLPRGFGVVGMGNEEGPAMFERQLREGLEELLHDDLEWVAPMPIRAINIGKFEKGKYTVQFTFDYEFDPIPKLLLLKGIEAKLGETTMPITMDDLKEYRQASEIFKKLKPLYLLVDEHNQNRFQLTLNALLQQNNALLIKQGYSEIELGNNKSQGSLERQLGRKLTWADSVTTHQKPIYRFKLITKGVFGADKQQVGFAIFYEYNKKHPSLRPSSVTAKVDGQVASLKCNSNIPLPSADTMHNIATGKLDMKKMQALLQYKHDYSLKRVKQIPK